MWCITVAGRLPSRNAFICATMCSRGSPASGTASLVTARPSVPWQMAQLAARLREAVSWAAAGTATSAVAATMNNLTGILRKRRTSGHRLGRRGRRRRRRFLEAQDDFLVLADVDGDLAAVHQLAEQQLVRQRAADRVLDQARH